MLSVILQYLRAEARAALLQLCALINGLEHVNPNERQPGARLTDAQREAVRGDIVSRRFSLREIARRRSVSLTQVRRLRDHLYKKGPK